MKSYPYEIRRNHNGDGKSDILWQNTQTGLLCIWFMDGVNIKGSNVRSTFR
ncbi:MAG: hypothetical protein HQL05_11070 [Nitrospirae bacterium]|nr:hypothetical protein [Nitrospirota bacterium]